MASRAQQASVGLGQLTLDVGGATVDTSTIGSIKWGAETRDLPGQFRKGDDVAVALVARVVAVNIEDKYDAHGNAVETIRKHAALVSAAPLKRGAPPAGTEGEGRAVAITTRGRRATYGG
jgi:hypothetical protein